MRRTIPLYSKVLAWLAVNVLVLCVLLFVFLRLQFHLSLDWMLAGSAGDRIEAIGNTLAADLSKHPESEWSGILQQYDAKHGVTFALFSSDGSEVLGAPVKVPTEVMPKLIDKRMKGERPPAPRRPPSSAPTRPSDAPPKPRFMQRAGEPARYWAGIHIDLVYGPDQLPLTLAMVSNTITGGGLFVDLWPWANLCILGLLLSALVWIPFVRGLTRSIEKLNQAAHRIAHGNFNERVVDRRNDELGELSLSVNTMAQQLDTYVEQQRRITADVAHELCSPIARMQLSLGIIVQRSLPAQASYLGKIDRELQHMAKLVEEVLLFTRAAHPAEQGEPELIELKSLIETVVAREAADVVVNVSILELTLHSLREALDRAISNIVRNAVRYASHAGSIDIKARTTDSQHVEITIRDHGSGVPANALDKIFDAFFRIDPARGRHTGGAGLGLAIVRRCVVACGGHVEAILANPGMVFIITLPSDARASRTT